VTLADRRTCKECGRFFYPLKSDPARRSKCRRCHPPDHAKNTRPGGRGTAFELEALRRRELAALREANSRSKRNK